MSSTAVAAFSFVLMVVVVVVVVVVVAMGLENGTAVGYRILQGLKPKRIASAQNGDTRRFAKNMEYAIFTFDDYSAA